MQFSKINALLAVAAGANAVAIPEVENWKTSTPAVCTPSTVTSWGTSTSTVYTTSTSAPWGKGTTTSTPWGKGTTTSTAWGKGTTTSAPWGKDTTTKPYTKPTSLPPQPTTTIAPWTPTTSPSGPATTEIFSTWTPTQTWSGVAPTVTPTTPPNACCDDEGIWSFIGPDQCTASGGTSYQCTSVGLLNILNCINLLDGNTISIPISISIL